MDIQHIVLDLKRLGMTQAAIAAAISCSQSTISEIQNGKIGKSRPSYQLVTDLRQLHRQKLIDAGELTDVDAADDVQPPAGTPDRKEGE
ncbi:helix-turn-helix domain-containing protein [Burkholderia cepacia]|uniref:helix-turn-helix domain-containing protein n=1 Tax=Burkholderia cepacia TaxID=292 RepID=UPI000754B28C|nr:helix-turn-helix domain-containing protein [Burkholderia cepacia]KWH52544.1 hypothetical protein WM00_19455 [Burkholderia cepacia]